MATINGTRADDTISFSGYGNTARAKAGNDTVRFEVPDNGGSVRGTAYGDAGDDSLRFDISTDDVTYRGTVTLDGGAGNDTLGGSLGFAFGTNKHPADDLDVVMRGGAGNDTLNASTQLTGSSYVPEEGGGNRDMLYGGKGDDVYVVQERSDHVIERAGEGYDTVRINHTSTDSYKLPNNVERVEPIDYYDQWTVDITGNGQSNYIYGTDAENTLKGLGGADSIYGGGGADRIVGGGGADHLYGGAGADRFDYNSVSESRGDVVHDFEGAGMPSGDVIDLSDIGALRFIGTKSFTKPGQVRAAGIDMGTVIEVNTSGNGGAEMKLLVAHESADIWVAEDFIL